MIFSKQSAIDYQAALVTEKFVRGGEWKPVALQTCANCREPSIPNIGQLHQIQQNVGNLTRLNNEQCLQAYATSMYETDWRNVLVVTSANSSSLLSINSLLAIYPHTAAATESDIGWPCYGAPEDEGCNVKSLLADPGSWAIQNIGTCPDDVYESSNGTKYLSPTDGCDKPSAPVEYCLAEPFEPRCAIHVSTALLSVVIVCNIIKVICLVTTAALRAFNPLATIGDAIATFLSDPDSVTAGKGALEVADVSSGVWKTHAPVRWTRSQRQWRAAVALPQWYMCICL